MWRLDKYFFIGGEGGINNVFTCNTFVRHKYTITNYDFNLIQNIHLMS